jgi:peptide/nickel transport system substrate-binding protein
MLQQSDAALIARAPVVAAELLRRSGFTVDLQSMDSNTLVSRRAKRAGWNIFLAYQESAQRLNPISINHLNATGYPDAWFGWPFDPDLQKLLDSFAFASSEQDRKEIAEQIQVRAMEVGTHVPLGEFHTQVSPGRTSWIPEWHFNTYWNLRNNERQTCSVLPSSDKEPANGEKALRVVPCPTWP